MNRPVQYVLIFMNWKSPYLARLEYILQVFVASGFACPLNMEVYRSQTGIFGETEI